MQEKFIKPVEENKTIIPKEKRPDDKSGVLTQCKIKIFDPQTNEVFVEQRA